jgi:DNA-binding Lrp family transcriptional regulator
VHRVSEHSLVETSTRFSTRTGTMPGHHPEIDVQILHALHLDARAPFSRIASVIGVSDQTVARRYARAYAPQAPCASGGLVDPSRLGQVEWLVRIRCIPDSAGEVASALARRTDASWISRTSGGTELVCRTWAPTPADELLLKTLPRSARILDVSAHCLLHVLFGRDNGVITKPNALSPEQAARLGLRIRTLLWLTVAPAHLDSTGAMLAGHPEVGPGSDR